MKQNKPITQVTKRFARKHLPIRSKLANKTQGGKLLIIAGSKGMYGAGILSALAATRAGAGYTYLMMDWEKKDLLKHPDILFVDFKFNRLNKITADAFVIGPGLGKSKAAIELVKHFIRKQIQPVVLDADGLNLLAKMKVPHLPSTWILTPHEGELARLLNTTSEKIRKDPKTFLKKAHEKFGCVILLKGSSTYITDGKNYLKCSSGTPALAKAGTGDVLAGIIGAMLAQRISSVTAAGLGTYIHGLASQKFLRAGNDVLSLRPIDLIELLPKTLKLVRR